MDLLDPADESIRNEYAVEIELQDLLYSQINSPNFVQSSISFIFKHFEYLNRESNIIPIAYQLCIASIYRPNNSIQLAKCTKLFISSLPSFQNSFSSQLFNIITKYLHNIKCFPSISPLVYYSRRIYEEEIISIEQIIMYMNSIKNDFDSREIVFLFFVVFAPEIEEFDLDSYDLFFNIVEELSYQLTSDDEYQVSDEGQVYHPYRAFLLNFCKAQKLLDLEEEDNIENGQETDKWDKLKESIRTESDATFPLLKAIKDDDVAYLQMVISNPDDYNVNQTVPKSVFEPNPQANQGCSLIEYCALFGSIKCFKILLLNNARLSFTTHIYALIGGNLEIIHLIEQQIESTPMDSTSKLESPQPLHKDFFPDALHYAALYHQNLLFQWLVETKEKSLYEYDYQGYSVISNAALSNNIDCLLYILSNFRIDPNYPDLMNSDEDTCKTALIHACENGCYDVCKILLSKKSIKINLNKYSALHAALRYRHFNIVHLLCQRKDINLNIADENGSTPLHLAIMNNDFETAKMIILATTVNQNNTHKYTVNINVKNKISLFISF